MEHDPDKAARNLRKHAADFEGCEAIFDGPTYEEEDRTVDYHEQRRNVIGFLRGQFMFLTYTDRDGEFRPISLRKAEPHEIEKLRRHLRLRLSRR